MRSKLFQNLMCFAVLWLGTQSIHAHSQNNQESQTMEQAKIQSTVDTNNAAVSAGDLERALASFEPNAVVMAQPGMPAMGTPALREAFQQFMGLKPKITVTGHDIIQAGDIALHQSTWKMSGHMPDGKAFEQSGFSTVVLRKQPDGRWLMVIDNPFGDRLLHSD
jgi:uncharacterized protein (TIGR02246 family)